MSQRSLAYATAVSLTWLACGTAARAEPAPEIRIDHAKASTADGVYGRFDGDLDLSLAAGAELLRDGPGGIAMARAFYLETAGMYVAYGSSFGNFSAVPPRSIGIGIGLRPFFLPRWGNDLDRGPALLDLTLDAVTFDIGVVWAADQEGHFTHAAGLEVGLGTEIPLAGQAAGPWIGARGALRWRGWELGAADGGDPAALGPALYLTFGWHVLVDAHIVDAGDGVLR